MRSVVANPFEDADALYRVLMNAEGQYSLWPDSLAVPGGWSIARESGSRSDCVQFIEENWTDMRPRSVIAAAGG
jgi:uncharacterized protein YbdZ (MbtH family)